MLNKAGLAKEFDVSMTTIDSWIRRGMPYVSKGRNGRSWQFDLDECREWKTRQENYPFHVEPPQGYSGNCIRDFTQQAIEHFFYSVMSDFLPPVSGMLRQQGIADELNKKMCVFIYLLAECFALGYLKKDSFNKYLASCGEDIDGIWNLVCLKHLQRSRTYPIVETLQRPDSVQILLQDKKIESAAKAFCRGAKTDKRGNVE